MVVSTHRFDQRKHLDQEVSFRNGIVVSPDLEFRVFPLGRAHLVYNSTRDDELFPLLDDVFLTVEGEMHFPIQYREIFG